MADLQSVIDLIENDGDLRKAFKLFDQWKVESDQQLAKHQVKLDELAKAVNGLNQAVNNDL